MLRLYGGGLAHRRSSLDLPGLDVVVPVFVMFFRPSLVDVAVAHRVVRAFQADRAEIDVPQGDRHHRPGGDGVHQIGLDHHRANLIEVRKIEDQARGAHDKAQHDDAAPEPKFLPGVEPARRNVLPRNHSARLHEPAYVVEARQVVLDEHHDEHQQAYDEHGAGEIVKMLGQLGEPREQGVADHRKQHVLAQHDDEPCHAQNAEAYRDDPVHVALERREALYQPPGRRPVDLDAPAPLVERADDQDDGGEQPADDGGDPAVLELPPGFPVRLDEHARLTPLDRRVFFLPGAHVAPGRSVVIGLGLGALLLGFLLRHRAAGWYQSKRQYKGENTPENHDRFHRRAPISPGCTRSGTGYVS